MIHFENVSISFGNKKLISCNKKRILHDVNFDLRKGEILCLLGPSGCGKSTMVNLIMGNLIASEGTVTVMGESAPYKNIRKKIGYMPQENALYEDITAFENLIFFGTLNGMSRKEMQERLPLMLQMARLENEKNNIVSNFSGGMKRRLSLGITMLHDPDLLVLDEPTVGLDPDHRRRIWENFDELVKSGKTILVTTHVMDEAERCNKIAMLYEGSIIATGSPEDIMSKTNTSRLEDAFLVFEENVHDRGVV